MGLRHEAADRVGDPKQGSRKNMETRTQARLWTVEMMFLKLRFQPGKLICFLETALVASIVGRQLKDSSLVCSTQNLSVLGTVFRKSGTAADHGQKFCANSGGEDRSQASIYCPELERYKGDTPSQCCQTTGFSMDHRDVTSGTNCQSWTRKCLSTIVGVPSTNEKHGPIKILCTKGLLT